ncbi:MAG TPA: hypothetical protein DCL86_07080 [Bacteroidales bacterium]|nr:hypothetical protein [Bacteroidales bacterium]
MCNHALFRAVTLIGNSLLALGREAEHKKNGGKAQEESPNHNVSLKWGIKLRDSPIRIACLKQSYEQWLFDNSSGFITQDCDE